MDRIKEVSGRASPKGDTEVSTILHEFAHLLGADHTSDKTCILSPLLETKASDLGKLATTYCDSDLIVIRAALGE